MKTSKSKNNLKSTTLKQSTNSNKPSNTIETQILLKLLHTIAKSIYAEPVIKIREAVANAMDNNADKFLIYIDRNSRTISLFDNGNGISSKKLAEIFKHIGSGVESKDRFSNSYFGLGLMSIIALGKKAVIFSQTQNEFLKIEIDTDKIFDKKNENEPIDFINNLVKKSNTDLTHWESFTSINKNELTEKFKTFPSTFTEIILQDIEQEIFDKILITNFEIELTKLLPLKPEENEPFLQTIKDETAKEWIIDIFKNKNYCPTIDVFLGMYNEKDITPLYKYYPSFKKFLDFNLTDIFYGFSEDEKFGYYYVCATEDLEKTLEPKVETGFWVRNKNFLVREADNFQKPGTRQKLLHEPLKTWLFGEIFHKNMIDFLIVTRNDYVWNSDGYEDFYKNISKVTEDLNSRLRKNWQFGNKVAELIIKPFEDIDATFLRTQKTISNIGISCDGADAEKILKKLNEQRDKDIEDESKSIDKLLSKDKMTIYDDENSKIVIDNEVPKGKNYVKIREPKTDKILINISPSIFNPRDVIFLGRTFKVIPVAGVSDNKGISIDVDNKKIYINPFNFEILNYSISFIDVYIAVELADIMSKDKTEMKQYLLKLLGEKYKSPRNYLIALSDELQRRKK